MTIFKRMMNDNDVGIIWWILIKINDDDNDDSEGGIYDEDDSEGGIYDEDDYNDEKSRMMMIMIYWWGWLRYFDEDDYDDNDDYVNINYLERRAQEMIHWL